MRHCSKALTPTRCTGAAGGALTSMRVFQVGHWEICDVFDDAMLQWWLSLAIANANCCTGFQVFWALKDFWIVAVMIRKDKKESLKDSTILETMSSTIKQTPVRIIKHAGMIAISGATVPWYQCVSSTCQANHNQWMTWEDRILWFTGPDLKMLFFTSTHRLFHQRIMVLWPWSIRFCGAGTVISVSHDVCFKLPGFASIFWRCALKFEMQTNLHHIIFTNFVSNNLGESTYSRRIWKGVKLCLCLCCLMPQHRWGHTHCGCSFMRWCCWWSATVEGQGKPHSTSGNENGTGCKAELQTWNKGQECWLHMCFMCQNQKSRGYWFLFFWCFVVLLVASVCVVLCVVVDGFGCIFFACTLSIMKLLHGFMS